jgi:hypothetical protein
MTLERHREKAGLGEVPRQRYQALSAVFDVLLSPGRVADLAGLSLEPFRTDAGRRLRPLLDVEQPPVADLFDLSQRGRPRYLLYLHGVLQLDTPELEMAVDRLSAWVNGLVLTTARDYLVIHAACLLAPDGGALVLAAPSGAGKSTLTAALVAAGYGYLSDEFAPIDPVHGLVHPFPKPLTLKAGSWPLFPEAPEPDHPGVWFVTAEQLGGRTATGCHAVRWVVLPRWRAGGAIEVEELSPGALVLAVAEQALGSFFYGARAIDLLARACRGARGVRIEYDDVADVVRYVDAMIAAASGAPT